ncbi:unnamed protein product [Danaus chrysippus]|uniref:(African queen) hypothetical protein n=1 Tax=Danaus chrysippus TaxID=151541 RepID=A0A8J2RGG4_9NEOP|nr:unnamed protein product [Danaus chrysippus]
MGVIESVNNTPSSSQHQVIKENIMDNRKITNAIRDHVVIIGPCDSADFVLQILHNGAPVPDRRPPAATAGRSSWIWAVGQQHKMANPRIIGFIIFSMLTLAAANVPKYKLNNGNEMPAIALGTYLGHDENGKMKSINKQLRDVVMQAVDVGYRHFDTAQIQLERPTVAAGGLRSGTGAPLCLR